MKVKIKYTYHDCIDLVVVHIYIFFRQIALYYLFQIKCLFIFEKIKQNN